MPISTAPASNTEAAEKAEWAELLHRIKESAPFRGAKDKCDLLDYLWKLYPEAPRSLDVETGFFGVKGSLESIDDGRSRVALGEVRKKLKVYFQESRGEKWLAELSMGKGGYRLSFTLAHRPKTSSEAFWIGHLRSFEEPVLISGSHLFFFDTETDKITRYYDFNMATDDRIAIISRLHSEHPEAFGMSHETSTLEPWHDVYLSAGDVGAYELFLQWFYKRSDSQVLIKRLTTKQISMSDVLRKNVILIGRPETNPIIEKLMDAPEQASRFAFRIHPQKGTVKVNVIDPGSVPELRPFPISNGGVVGPIWQSGKVFGVFTRFLNPSGRGHITIISCGHYAMVIARIVGAMTDELNASELLRRM